ncbi:hypothetical protein P8C59_009374 [Phyllachora maydis]|uniref:Large ribosomal subunit protein mL50 n=1 Tax=Phyllachora maydis TaxID=1825666 RepID=A0AAD9ICH2_9PEZI|nr:hypothetical protein P8C59_009374 [Phyllachora maydis]
MRNLQRIRGHASLLSNSSAAGQPAVPLAPSPPTTICLLKRRELSTATRRDAFPAPSTARLLARRPTVVRSVLLGPSDSRRLVSTRPSPPRRRGIPPFGQYPQSITEVEAADALGGATYTPAASGENLEEVGGLDDWWEDPHHWSESYDPPRPFGPTEAAGDKARLLAGLVRQALLEATAVRAMGKPKDLLKTWAVMSEEAAHGAEGPAAVAGQGDDGLRELAARLLKRLPKNVTMARDSAGAIANAAKLLGGDGQAWTEISLDEDAAFRFAVVKRIQQLTGRRIPDHKLMGVGTAGDLLAATIPPPRPLKLAQELQAKEEVQAVPNLKIYSRRVTPIDKEKMVGRWKVMVDELQKRDLPVTGTGRYSKSVEEKWIMGKF